MQSAQIILETILNSIKSKGITEKQCLMESGVNTNFLSDWKGGQMKYPSYDKIVKIAEYLEISLDYLLRGKKYNNDADNDLTENEKELLELFKDMSEREQLKLIGKLEAEREQRRFVKAMADNIEMAQELPDLSKVYNIKNSTATKNNV